MGVNFPQNPFSFFHMAARNLLHRSLVAVKRNAQQSLSVTQMEPMASLWHHLVSPIRLALVAQHPDRNPDHKREGLKPWLSAVGVKPSISYSLERFAV